MSTKSELSQLLAERAITAVLRRYCTALDRGDTELLRSVYTSDAIDDRAGRRGPARDFIERTAAAFAGIRQRTHHNLSNVEIWLGEGAADAVSNIVAFHRYDEPVDDQLRPADDGEMKLLGFGGRYLDRLRCVDGEWKIAERTVVEDWTYIWTIGDGNVTERSKQYLHGCRGAGDPSLAFRR